MSERVKILAKIPTGRREFFSLKAQKTNFSRSTCSPINHVLHLQRTIGNQALQRLFKSGMIQVKPRIGKPNDIYEQEADRVADMVLQRQRSTPKCEEEEMFQMKQISVGREKTPEGEIGQDVTEHILERKGSEKPLEPETREFMESRFGYNFGNVRIHTDSHAAETSTRIGAEAFTVGRDIYLGSGKYSPASTQGKRLLAHELTHVVQQSNINLYMVQRLSYDSDYGPSAEHCAIYQSPLSERWFTYSYRNNAWCACQRTPDELHNNCVRRCLQEKMKAYLERESRSGRVLPTTFPLEADPLCHDMWEQHVECYQECECENEFINYPVFSIMCRTPFPCALVGTSIDWFNACME